MSFKFNFHIEGSNTEENSLDIDEKTEEKDNNFKAEAKEIFVEDKHMQIIDCENSFVNTVVGDLELSIISLKSVRKLLRLFESDTNILNKAIKLSTDLIEGEYEGGLKLWEGAIDLCNYLMSMKEMLSEKRILEIGCGSGLPGLYAFKHNALVDFQDYNEEVLYYCTIPNVLKNTIDWCATSPRCRFFAGDWNNVCEELKKRQKTEVDKYDMIFTSETIYNPTNHVKLLNLMKETLKENGEVYLAAKTYYFGVGGGIEQFKQLVKDDNYFDLELCWTNTEGLKREIIKLKKK